MQTDDFEALIAECETYDGPPIGQNALLRRAFDAIFPDAKGYEPFRFRSMLHVSAFESAAILLIPEEAPPLKLLLNVGEHRPNHDGLWSLASLVRDTTVFAAWAHLPALAIAVACLVKKSQMLADIPTGIHFTPIPRARTEAET